MRKLDSPVFVSINNDDDDRRRKSPFVFSGFYNLSDLSAEYWVAHTLYSYLRGQKRFFHNWIRFGQTIDMDPTTHELICVGWWWGLENKKPENKNNTFRRMVMQICRFHSKVDPWLNWTQLCFAISSPGMQDRQSVQPRWKWNPELILIPILLFLRIPQFLGLPLHQHFLSSIYHSNWEVNINDNDVLLLPSSSHKFGRELVFALLSKAPSNRID